MFVYLFYLENPLVALHLLQRFLTPEFIINISLRLVGVIIILLMARLIVLFIQRMISRGITAAVKRSGESSRRLTTLNGVLVSAFSYLIYFIAIILVLFTFGVPPGTLAPLLGAASVLGLAVGFGAQRLVRDVITGLFILGEGQFNVGDWVTIGGVSGRVEDIGLRVTRLCDQEGRLYVIANGDITQVFNASRGLVKLTVELSLQRSQAFDEGLALIQSTATTVLEDYAISSASDQEPVLWLVGMDAVKVTVRLVLWVPVRQLQQIEDAVRRRLLYSLADAQPELTLA